jgi:hypothetical protein
VADSFVSFTRTFQYLDSLISFNLRDNDDITTRIAAANASTGALKEVWCTPHLNIYNKYLLFRAIPINLLLWGAETSSQELKKVLIKIYCIKKCLLDLDPIKFMRTNKVL